MPWLAGRVHEAAAVSAGGIQRCVRCKLTDLAGLDSSVTTTGDPYHPVKTLILEETNPTPRPGVFETVFRVISQEDRKAGPFRFCDDLSPWPPGEEPE